MRILNTLWFSGSQGIIGIVLGQDDHTGEPKAYIGLGVGYTENSDVQIIAQMGAIFMPKAAEILHKHFNKQGEGDAHESPVT